MRRDDCHRKVSDGVYDVGGLAQRVSLSVGKNELS